MEFLKRLLVDFFYFLHTWSGYQKTKRFFHNFLENEEYKAKKYFDYLMILLIIVSIISLIREVKHEVDPWLVFFNHYVISMIFLIEYIIHLWISSSVSEIVIRRYEESKTLSHPFKLRSALLEVARVKVSYIFSAKAMIDLIAVLPFFHQLRLLRIFKIMRVFKLFRYAKSFQTFASVFTSKRFEFITLFIFSTAVIIVSAVLIYALEADLPNTYIVTLFDAFYWSFVTMATVGHVDIVAVTQGGKSLAVFVIISGIAVLAFITSLVVSAFTEKIDDIRETKIVNSLVKNDNFYIICGYEDIASEVAQKLVAKGHSVIVLDEDFTRAQNARRDGLVVLNYDPGSVASYEKLQIDFSSQVKAILCMREDDVANVYTALTIRSIDPKLFILSLLVHEANRKKLLYAGANEILFSKEIVGLVSREYISHPVAFEAIHALSSQNSEINIDEVLISQRIAEQYVYVGDLPNREYKVVLFGIYKKTSKRFFFNPIDSTLLQEGDYMIVIGHNSFVKEFEQELKKR